MATATVEFGSVPTLWNRRHLLGLEDLSAEEITLILDKAEVFKRATSEGDRKIPLLTGKTCVNLFFENSTRTRNSFALAARRLGADTIDFSASTSSLSKGETFIDTAKNIEAMGVDSGRSASPHAGHPAPAGPKPSLRRDQRRRRRPRAPDAGPAGHHDHPPA